MKKFLKGLIITIVILAALYIIPCVTLQNRISKIEVSSPAQLVTDFTLLEEDTYEISEGDFSVRIPTYYASTNVREYYTVVADAPQKNRTLLIYYKPMDEIANLLGTGTVEYKNYLAGAEYFEENKPGYPLNLLFDIPEDVFDTVKFAATTEKEGYNPWNLAEALETYYYLSSRQIMDKKGGTMQLIYERENVRAVVVEANDLPGEYIIMLMPKNRIEDLYGIIMQTPDINEITKLLNTFEYTTGFGF